jgi:hypothetical protein
MAASQRRLGKGRKYFAPERFRGSSVRLPGGGVLDVAADSFCATGARRRGPWSRSAR